MEQEYFVFHLVIGFAAAFFAVRKGRWALLWLSYGLAAGPIALIHAMVIKPTEDVSARRDEEKEEDRVRCPKCFEPIKPYTPVCPFCNANLGGGVAR